MPRPPRDPLPRKVVSEEMATGETGFSDVVYDLVSVQYHSLKAGHDYGQYVRDADNAGLNDIAQFFRDVMDQDSQRAAKCHEFLTQLSGTEQAGPAAS
jgi:bacterioferritin (cytochrome b1)